MPASLFESESVIGVQVVGEIPEGIRVPYLEFETRKVTHSLSLVLPLWKKTGVENSQRIPVPTGLPRRSSGSVIPGSYVAESVRLDPLSPILT